MAVKTRGIMSVEQLNDMQRYLGEEIYDNYKDGWINRRQMLKRVILICGSSAGAAALLAACGDTATPVPSTTSAVATTTNATTTIAAMTSAATTTSALTNAATTTSGAAMATTASSNGTTVAATTTAASKSPLSVAANDPDIQGSDVTFQSDVSVFGYLARPKATGNYATVIVIHQNTGLTEHIKDVARRVAKAGYIALAPDLASRGGGTGKFSADTITKFFADAKPTDMVKDLNTAVDFVQKQDGAQAGKIGVVGFCYGGGLALSLAAANPKILAGVSYYGPAPQPVSQMSATNAAILGQYGALDTRVDSSIPPMEQVLKDSGKTFMKNIYDGANHAFNDDTRPSYVELAALPAWKATLDWSAKYLK